MDDVLAGRVEKFRRRSGGDAFLRWVLPLLVQSTATYPLPAEEPPDKSGYTLFNPVPRELMRPMSLDRPDKTESPFTVDAGHFQLEMDLVNYAHDRESERGVQLTTDAFAIAPMNWKAGLANRVDFQVVAQTFNHLRIEDSAGQVESQSGFGDVLTRLKINLWGNDGGPTALAVMPYVVWPTSQNGLGAETVQGGIIVPFAADLPAGWGLGMMTEFDFGRAETATEVAASFVNTITVGRDIVGPLAGYVEFFSEVSTEADTPWIGTVDFGLTYAVSENLMFDVGINFGVTRSAPDFNPFLGLAYRF
ncbi:MAG TPA: transporter [Verrucomicrobiota bacterium]|nr:hypothetical protein [Verrucomicrobiales bacterium]HRI12339.1 transporter [Verrucomicrobiota bacterium]